MARTTTRLHQAITVLQPYAHLIAAGAKFCENRPWAPRRDSWGWIVIHAGAGHSMDDDCEFYDLDPARLVYGALVAVARLAICIDVEAVGDLVTQDPDRFGWLADHEHVNGPKCWVFDAVIPLARPIDYRGSRGLWELPAYAVERVRSEGRQWRTAHGGKILMPETAGSRNT